MWWLPWFNAKTINLNDVAIVFVKRNDYRIQFSCMSKDEFIDILKNFHLNEKKKKYYPSNYHYFFKYM